MIGQGALNGIARINLLFVRGKSKLLLGLATRAGGAAGFALAALVLYLRREALKPVRS